MNLLELAKKAEKKVISSPNGVGSSIIYYSFETNTSFETRAIVSYEDFRSISTDKEIISDSGTFYSVELNKSPKKRDKISFDGEAWLVVDFRPTGFGFYDIYCEKNVRHSANADKNTMRRR